MTSLDALQAFDLNGESYDRWFDSPEGRMIFGMELAAVRLLMNAFLPPFLEVGVGSGRFAEGLGIEFGVDPSARLLAMAMKRGIKVRKAPGEALPFKDRSFGGVFILFTLCFVKDPFKVIAEAGRVLRQEGRIIAGIINRESPWGRLYLKKRNEGHPIYRHARFYNVEDVINMLHTAAFAVDAYSSTLCQPPSAQLFEEKPQHGLIQEAGFTGIRAIKSSAGDRL